MKVVDVKTMGRKVVFLFDDQHRAVFEPYSHGIGYQVEGLMAFSLFSGDELVCRYNARIHYSGPRSDEHMIVRIEQGYTPQCVASYWKSAKDHIHREYYEKPLAKDCEGPEELWYPWMVATQGWLDLKMLEEGKTKLT